MTEDRRFDTPVKLARIETPWREYARFNKYDDSFPQILYEEMTKGKTLAQIAKLINCSKTTLLKWCSEIEDMSEALEMGETNFEAEIETMIQENMIHNDPDEAPPVINNKLVDVYMRSNIKKFKELDRPADTNININNGTDACDVMSKIADIMSTVEKISNSKKDNDKMIDITPEIAKIETKET